MADKTEALARIGAQEELRISSRRPDGSLRPAITIWSVLLDGSLYVRSANGVGNGWFRRAVRSGAGRVSAGGEDIDVTFEHLASDDQLHAALDGAYRRTYAAYPAYVKPVVTADAHAATLRVRPA